MKDYAYTFENGVDILDRADSDEAAILAAKSHGEARGWALASIHNEDGCVWHIGDDPVIDPAVLEDIRRASKMRISATYGRLPSAPTYTVELNADEVETIMRGLTKLSRRGKDVNKSDLATNIATQIIPQALARML